MLRLLIPLVLLGAAWWLYGRWRAQVARDGIARARADFLATAEDDALDGPGLREVDYRGGLVRFHIPATWRDEYDPEGGGTFFDPASRQRTLRLHTLAIEKPGQAGRDDMAFLLGSLRPRSECTLATLADGRLLLKHVDTGREAGIDLVLYTWQLARSISADRARLAVFTLAVPAAGALDVLSRDDRRRVERIVRAARIADA
jgi:hypothetical protein